MAANTAQPEDLAGSDSIEVGTPELAWSQAWQVPVLLLGLGLLTVGLYLALPRLNPPDYDKSLATIDAQIQANQLEEAKQNLDTLGKDELFIASAGDDLKGYYWQLNADLRFRQLDNRVWQGIAGEADQENLRQIARYYEDADRLGRKLPVLALRRYAQALAALGEDRAALAVVDRMPPTSPNERQEIVMSLIERRRQSEPDPSSPVISRLLERFEEEVAADQDRARRLSRRIWAMEIRGGRLLQAGDPDAVTTMLVEGGLMRLKQQGATEAQLAPLKVLLGESLAVQGEFVNAKMQLRAAQQHVAEGSPLEPRILLAMAEIELAQEESPGREERAYQLFRQAYDKDTMGPTSIQALTGLGLTESLRPGRFAEGVEHFSLAVDRLLAERVPDWDPRRKKLSDYLHERADSEYARGNYLNALDLLEPIERLQSPDITPQLRLSFAQAFEQLADQSLDKAKALEPSADPRGADPNLQARRIHYQDAARYYERAGDAYYARAGQLTHLTDEHGEALWAAAQAYSSGQLWDKAAGVYADFLAMQGDSDKREEARYELGRAYLAAGMPQAAIEHLEALTRESQNSAYAFEAYVPLARAYQAVEDWERAEKLLRWVTEGHPSIGPTSPYFRDALVELGGLYYRRGQDNAAYYSRAIEVLGEEGGAISRFFTTALDDEDGEKWQAKHGPRLRFMLADSLRLSAAGLLKRARDARSELDRLEAQNERLKRLQQAQMYYFQTLTELDDRDAEAMDPIERIYHRNAYFYMADCAYARADYANAILLYQDAAQRWQSHPASLVAWVQIINCAAEMGDYERAKAAHRQANELFDRLPPEVFDHPDSLMTRQRWDDWLRWSTQLDLYANGGGQAGVGAE
ncbi:MAG: hypothetical protein AAGH88_10055 [Planctomycetota bacterium]